jgi:plasmid stability protein
MEKRRVVILGDDLHLKVKIAAAKAGQSMREYVEEILVLHLKEKGNGSKTRRPVGSVDNGA